MKEEIISFETAKLANKADFNWSSEHRYNKRGTFNYSKAWSISAPTQSLLQKWLREEHGLFLTVGGGVFKGEIEYQPAMFTNKTVGMVSMVKPYYPTYEEALEAGLQEAFKLIGR